MCQSLVLCDTKKAIFMTIIRFEYGESPTLTDNKYYE